MATTLAQQPGASLGSSTASAEGNRGNWKRLTLAGELRSRVEAPDGLSFAVGVHDLYALTRMRLSAAFRAQPWLTVFGEAQDVRAPGYNKPVPWTAENPLDVRQAYVEVGVPEGSGWRVRTGRQTFKFGKGRLVWDPDWGNGGRNFDGVRVTLTGRGTRLDAFAASPVAGAGRYLDRSDTANRFFGLYWAVERWGNNLRFETYLFEKCNTSVRNELGQTGTADLYTVGARATGLVSTSVDWETEVAFQSGRNHGLRGNAFGGVWVVGWRTGEQRWQPRVAGSYTYASGDNDPGDGRKGTFDTLYPTTHMRNGATDRIGWANIHDGSVQADWKLGRKIKVSAGGHDFRLATILDGLYAPSGTIVLRNAKASSGHIGEELFAAVDCQVAGKVSLGVGYAHLFRGAFLRESGRGGASQPYVFLTYRF